MKRRPLQKSSTDKPANEPEVPRPPWRVEGAPPEPGSGQPPPPRTRPSWFAWLAAALFVNWIIAGLLIAPATKATLSYTAFVEQVNAGNVANVSSKGDAITGTMKREITVDKKKVTEFKTQRPSFADDKLLDLLKAKGVIVNARSVVTDTPLWANLLLSFGPTLLIVGLLYGATRSLRGAGGLGGIGGIGRSKAVRGDEAGPARVTFADVAGIDEVEDQLSEIVEMLRHPDKYRKVGAQLPRGVLLSGPPGTGKTLLARAVAGEAGVPFFSASASEFIEMIVGVGASRVRDLFDQAKKVAPSMIFIDELDAIGRARGGGASMGGVDEREQTLNQILTEMDGFTRTDGVVVIAATNRPDVLDPALLRPGRFDRRIVVNPPDMTGRQAILAIHTRTVPLADDVSLGHIASITPGMVGADIKNLVNEAALLAAKNDRDRVTLADFTESLEKIILGAERNITLSEEDRTRTAYHEGGHALLGMLIPGADPVRKISIIPRGTALGVTFQTPDTDRYGYDAEYLRGRIIGALGGRAAEQIVFGTVTTGAESDLEQITSIARQMVGRWGMSEAIGPVTVLPSVEGNTWFPGDPRSPSESTRELVDAETRSLIEACYGEAISRLKDHRDQLDRLALSLLAAETLDEDAAYAAAGIPVPVPTPLRSDAVRILHRPDRVNAST
jgi:cell division protease FtsH